MRNNYFSQIFSLLFLIASILSTNILYSNGGIGYKGLKLNLKGTSSWYNIHGMAWGYQGCGDYGETFYNGASENWNGTNLGTFSTSHAMEIIDFSVIGWTDGSDYLAGKLEYKIWLQSDPEPAFWTQVNIGNYQFPSAGVANVACESGNDRVIAYNSAAIDIQPGVAGTYNFKVKGFGRMQYTGGGGGSFNDNDGSELTATFTIVECSIGSVSASHTSILRGNDITWTYTGNYFDSYEFQWNSTAGTWFENFSSSNPHSWGSDCPACAPGTLYIRSKLVCAGDVSYTAPVSTYWDDCWVEAITTTVDGVSISNGGDFTINSTVEWTWPHDGSDANHGAPDEGGGSGHALGYYWESDPASNEDYVYAWDPNPISWTDNAGGQFTSEDRKLYVKSRATGDNSCTKYSSPFYITLKKPTITASAISGSMTACGGLASSSETFTLSGQYIASTSNGSAASQGITVTAPTDFEVSTDNSSFSDNLNVSTADGTIASTTIYVRMKSSATGTPSGNVVCSATSANPQNVAVSGIVSSTPAAPTGSASQNFCSAATIVDLTATGSSIQWYSASSGGAALATNTTLVDATSYYASQTVGGCESTDRLTVTASVSSPPAAPTGSASQDFCLSGVISDLSATGSSIQWYAASSEGSTLSAGSSLSDGTTYYASQTVSGCESLDRFAATVNILSSGTWIGETSTDWATAANWCGGVPSSSTSVVISSGTTYSPAIGASANAADVTINSGATLTINGSNTLTLADGGSFTNNGTFTGSSSGILFSGSATLTGTTTFNDLTINGALNPGSGTTINGTLTINSGGSISTNSPSYGSSSSLVYNMGGSYSRGLEWNASSGAGYPNNVTVSNSTTIDYPGIGGGSFSSNLQIGGTLTIDAGSSLYMDYGAGTASSQLTVSGDIIANGNLSLGDAIGGDLKIGGSWTRGASSTFNSNTRAVYFIGTGTSTINGNGGETFNYMINEKSSGSIQLASNLTVSAPNGGNALTHNSSASMDLNGNTLYLNNAAASTLLAEGGARTITGSGTISISGGLKTIGTANSGTLSFGSNVTIALAGGIDFGSSVSTVDGTLQINSGGYVSTNAPSYGSSALLHYNTGSSYNRSVEWVNTSSSGSGVPQNLQVGAGTSLVYGANSNTGSGITSYINGDLIVDGTFYHSDGGSNDATGTLVVSGNITAAGTIEIGSGTLDVDGTFDATGGNLTFSGSGNLKLGGSVTSFGTITQGSGKITYDGGNQTVLALNGNGTTGSYEDLEIAGTGTKTLSGTSDIYGDLILSSASFDLNGKTIYPKNDILTNSGEIIASSASNITYDNSGTHALSGVNSENITIKTTSTGGSVTSTGNINCGSIDLSSGTKTIYLDGETINVVTDIIVTAGTLNITDGIVNINSNSSNSCLVEGGILDIDGGVITIGNSTSGDISMTSGVVDISGGTLNIADEFDIEDGTVTQSGGIINVRSYEGSAQGSSANKFDMSAGTLNLTGGTLNLLGQKSTQPVFTAMNVASGVALNASTGHTTVISSNNSSSNDEDIYLELNGKSLGNLTIDLGGHEVYMNTDLNVLGNLTLTDGTFETSGNTLYLGSSSSNASISGGSASSYIVAYDNSGTIGKVVHYVNSNDTYNFPIGDANNYTPISLTLNSGTLSSANLTAYTMARKVDGMSDDVQTNINRSWSIEPSGITSPTYDVSYTYASGEWVGDQFFQLSPIKLSSDQWYRPTNSVLSGATPQGSGGHNTSTNTLTWTGLSSFSIFGGAGGGSALPVEMVSLNAECIAEGHFIEWVTASENNSDYFSLEYSRDGLNWLSVKEIDAAGFSNELITYTYMNPVTSDGDHYYRIIQNDIDGQSELFGPIHLNCGQSSNQKINIYPNPNSNEFYISIFEIENKGKAIIEILDLQGNVCFTESIQIADGVNVYAMDTDLSSGLYILRILKDSVIFDSKNLIIR